MWQRRAVCELAASAVVVRSLLHFQRASVAAIIIIFNYHVKVRRRTLAKMMINDNDDDRRKRMTMLLKASKDRLKVRAACFDKHAADSYLRALL